MFAALLQWFLSAVKPARAVDWVKLAESESWRSLAVKHRGAREFETLDLELFSSAAA